MFGYFRKTESITVPPPGGISKLFYCVLDEKYRIHHEFRSGTSAGLDHESEIFSNPANASNSIILREALSTHQPVTFSMAYGNGVSRYLYVLPYQRKRGKWRFACLHVETELPNPDTAPTTECLLGEDRMCLLLADQNQAIVAVNSRIPEAFGYSADHLKNMNMQDLFKETDMAMIMSCSADTNEAIISCVFQCLDGARREVEVRKYSSADHHHLYGICDITPPQITEEVGQITTRERRRIGQDLHDSIGQLLTGISLLSRSLANGLKRINNAGYTDAAQISHLADDASNQIRQISRGLMPAEIVQQGLYRSLHDLAQVTAETCGLACEAILDENVHFGDGAVETHLFRIAQEAVNNAVRHAGASRVEIIVEAQNSIPMLEIRDNGAWKEVADSSSGIGMRTMQYRASVIGGQLVVGPAEQGGTSVRCRLEAEELMETKV
jgi:PAS domain S-box-containing protein